MEEMKVLDKDAHDWLEELPPNTWVRAFQRTAIHSRAVKQELQLQEVGH